MSPDEVLTLAAMGWSLLFAYLPVAKTWLEGLSTAKKLLVQLGVFAVIIYGAFAGSCLGLLSYFACGEILPGLLVATGLFVKVILANQGMYQTTRLIAKAAGSE